MTVEWSVRFGVSVVLAASVGVGCSPPPEPPSPEDGGTPQEDVEAEDSTADGGDEPADGSARDVASDDVADQDGDLGDADSEDASDGADGEAPTDTARRDGGRDATETSDSASDTRDTISTDGADAGQCGNVGHGTPSQIAKTPRSETNLERLALTLTDKVVAPQSIYDRVVRDVKQIRSNHSEVAGIDYLGPHDGKTLIVKAADKQTKQAIDNGTFGEWSCLNRHYVEKSVDHLFDRTFTLELKGIYDLKLVAGDYDALPSLEYAETNRRAGDGPTICASRSGDTYHYIFDEASGDCPSGCIDHEYWYFEVTVGGTISTQKYWDGSGDRPSWMSNCN